MRLALLLAAGIVVSRLFPVPGFMFWVAAILLAAGSAVVALRTRPRSRVSWGSFVLPLFVCIVLGAARYADGARGSAFPVRHPVPSATAGGLIADEPVLAGGRWRFPLECYALSPSDAGVSLPSRILVTVRAADQDTMSIPFRYGERVLVRGRLELPTLARNPGEFDARSYYEANGISFFLRARSADSVTVLAGGGGSWWMRELVLPVRRFLLRHAGEMIGGEEGELLKGILIGERNGFSFALREAFVRSGTAHILAVSGSNVAVIAAMAFTLLQLLRAGRVLRALLTAAAVLFYVLLTGGQPPVLRAGLMAGIVLASGVLQERPHPFNALGLAAAVLMIADPGQAFDPGFQLSFAAVAGMLLIYPRLRGPVDRWTRGGWAARSARFILRLVALSLAATLGTLPLCAFWFGRVSIIGLVSNIIVVPAVGVSVILGVASSAAELVSASLARPYAAVNVLLLRLTLWTARTTGGLPWATVETPWFRVADAAVVYGALGVILAARKYRAVAWTAAAAALLWAMFASQHRLASLPADHLRITFLDVGQGDAILLQFPGGKAALVDAGPRSPEYDAGERVIIPYLRRCGIRRLDVLVVTHAHSDHAGGVKALLRALPVQTVVSAGACVSAAAALPETATQMRAGASIGVLPAVRLFVLSPACARTAAEEEAGGNDDSVVLKLCYGTVSILLAGDAGVQAEEEMCDRYAGFLRSDVLKVGHHGSAGATSERFLEHVSPSRAVVSVGAVNAFGLPSPETLQRLARRGIAVLRTDEEGAIVLETDGRTIERIHWREDGS